jgi:hypothetical protein
MIQYPLVGLVSWKVSFSISVKKIQSDSISGSEVAIELDIFSNKKKAADMIIFCATKLISIFSGRCLQ